MLTYLVHRVLQGIVVIWLVSFATFALMQIAPGNPIDILIGEAQVSQAQVDAIERKWGLDKPWYQQYATWLGNVATGDFGRSVIRTGVPVSQMVREAAPVTVRLNLLALGVAIAVALPIGVTAAVRRHSIFDYLSTIGATIGVSFPSYWIALMLIILFAQRLGWVPPYGSAGWKSYILPVIVLAWEQMAILTRLTRGATLEILGQDYVNTARAKGLRERIVLGRHVVRNALLPIVTLIGYQLAFILSGTIIVEYIFAFPGIGRLFFDSIDRLDYQVVQAIVLLLSTIVVVGNLVTDLVYAAIDPRIRLK